MSDFDVLDFVEANYDCGCDYDYDYDYIADDVSVHELDDFVNNITTAINDSVDTVSSIYDRIRDSDFY